MIVLLALVAGVVDDAEHVRWDRVSDDLAAAATASQPDGMTALHWAAVHGHAAIVAPLLAAGAEVDAETAYGLTPLSIACEYGADGVAAALIEADADVAHKRAGKIAPLHLASRNGSPAIVRALLAAGADANAGEAAGQTSLMWAAAAGHADAVSALLDGGADPLRALERSGMTALMFAARHGRLEVCRRLVAAGVPVDAVTETGPRDDRAPRTGMSAQMFAVESGHLAVALELVRLGADPNDQRSRFAPLHAISWVRRAELGDNPAGDPEPRITGGIDSLEYVRRLIAAGADVNLRLANAKVDPKRLNRKGATPFLLAARGADLPLMSLLLELGADPTIPNATGTTSLMAAAGVGVKAVGEEPGLPPEVNAAVRLLADLGLDVNAVDSEGDTAMHGAALRNYPSTVRLLAELGADPAVWNRPNSRGWTPHDIGHGKRFGSVKPSPPTLAALDEALGR